MATAGPRADRPRDLSKHGLLTRFGLIEKDDNDNAGDSEKAIARAFEEAADMRAFLILDEADSLLHDRASTHHWELTPANERLAHMERHPRPFARTTNAPELLDPATGRRFLFKLRFCR